MATINGTTGSDILAGTASDDTINGLDGSDSLTGHAGADTIDGGSGEDTVDYSLETGTAGIVVNLSAVSVTAGGYTVASGKARDSFGFVDTLISIENVRGGGGNDFIYGNGSSNYLVGGGGNDTIYGGGGLYDVLDGGDGNDALHGTSGTFYGGSGNDSYYFEGPTEESVGGYNLADVSDSSGTDTAYVTSGYAELTTSGVEQFVLDLTDAAFGTGSVLFLITSNNVTVTGSSGKDSIFSGSGNDTINGGDGGDTIVGRGGADAMTGGNGVDWLTYSTLIYSAAAGVTVDLVAGTGSGGDAQGDTFSGFENVRGTDHVDTISGDGNANVLEGVGGNDTLNGRGGNDTLDGGTGADAMSGGLGNDIYIVDNAGDVVTEASGEGTDEVRPTLASYTLSANVENLTWTNAASGFTGTGNTLANVITGNNAADTLYGLGGNDTLNGGGGNDVLDGGTGTDTMLGGTGDDTYYVDDYGEVVMEFSGQGTDTVRVDLYDYSMTSNVENFIYTGLDYIEVTGNGLDNVITLGGGEDTVYAGSGNDTVYGMAGDDVLNGEDDNDVLVGGLGTDFLTGGSGADTFRFDDGETSAGSNADYIFDFGTGTDKIDLSAIDANSGVGGDQGFSFLGTGAFTNTAGQLRYFTSGGNTTIQGDVNGDGVADFEIILIGTVTPTSGDFML